MPWIWATRGCLHSASDLAVSCMTRPYSIACALFDRAAANSPMSLPARTPSPGAAHDHAAQRVVSGERADRLAELLPHRLGQRVELLGPVERDRRNRAVARNRYRVGSSSC
jgi:hypothetical protein